LQPPENELASAATPRQHRAARVVVAGATTASGSGNVAAVLALALRTAGLENDSVEVVDAGSTLDGIRTASAVGPARYVIVASVNTATLAAAFAMVKAIESRQPGARIEILVTGHDESRAHGAYLRVRAAAERFLGRDVGFAGAFTDLDTASASFDESDDLELTLRRATRANRTARMWAARLLAECSEGAWPEAAHSMN
jgi:hypothetical protein